MALLQLSDLERRSQACLRNASQDRWDERYVLNVPLLRAVQDAIVQTPQQFTMLTWRRGDVLPGALDQASGQACIAGWAVVLSGRVRLSTLPTSRILSRACQAVGLRQLRSHHLFWLRAWPEEFRAAYLEEPRDYGEYLHNARVAGARIEVFIEDERRRQNEPGAADRYTADQCVADQRAGSRPDGPPLPA